MDQYDFIRNLENRIKHQRELVFNQFKAIIAAAIEKRIADYPLVHEYLTDKFPNIDINDIPIYQAPAVVFEQNQWEGVGGLFVPALGCILIRNADWHSSPIPHDAFDVEMHSYSLENMPIEEILVHECMHAISFKANRASQKYTQLEEEFVYTNCIDFYKSRGMNEDEIIERNFLPFCMQDVIANTKDMNDIFKSLFANGIKKIDYWKLSKERKTAFLNRHAHFLVTEIAKRAKIKGRHMIECYNKEGRGISLSQGQPESSRFADIWGFEKI